MERDRVMLVKKQTTNLFRRAVTLLGTNKKLLTGLIGFLVIVLLSLSVYPLSIEFPPGLGQYKPKLPPSAQHPLGTDNFGRGMVTVFLYAIQFSLYIGLIAGTIGTVIGVAVGFISGYRGGLVDHVLRSIVDIFLVMPLLPILAIIMVCIQGMPVYAMAILLGAFSWPAAARTIRSQMLSLKEREFIDLAKISGQNQFEILFKEIFPNMLPYLSIVFVRAAIGAMFAEVSLEVIGLGPTNANTLGFIFHFAIINLAVLKGWWWWILPPTVALVWTFASLYIITLGLDEISNPKLKRITGL